ncbi:MAG: PfkB family carbohydrate kinase [Anaerolineales bacterium]
MQTPLDYLLIGHVSADLDGARVRLGGTAAYSGLTASALGCNVGVVTAAAADLDLSPLASLSLFVLPSPHSTSFENRATAHGREQVLHRRATPLTIAQVPDSWRDADLVHLAPIADEVDPEMVRQFPNSFVGVTAQGWLRQWDETGRVRRKDFDGIRPALQAADVVVVSLEDLGGDLARAEAMAACCQVLAVTRAAQGATIYTGGTSRHVGAPPASEIDPTGAGDVFAPAFFLRLKETGDPWQAARIANQLAAASVTRPGLASVPTTAEVRQALLPVAS